MEVLSKEYKTHYRACVGLLIYIFFYKRGFMFCSTQAGKFISYPGKVNFEGLVQFLRYIRYNNKLVL